MGGALDGIRVVDFGQYIAGPLAAVMLADQGADVVHVDPPGGPRWTSPAEAFYNRGKRRIVLDLKQPDDRAIAQRLIRRADVVIENFRPGVMDRLGVGSADLTRDDPCLIYCSIPGFAADDPRAHMAAWEGVVSAAADIYHPLREIFGPADDGSGGQSRAQPSFTAIPLASNFAGFHAATSIVMALIARQRTGLGQSIVVPLFDALFELFGVQGISVNSVYPAQSPSPYGGGRYPCADGRWVQFSTTNPQFWLWFADGAGLTDWSADGLLDIDRLETEPELRTELRRRLSALFRTRPALEWERIANQAGSPMSMIRSAAEWIQTEHARTWGTVIPVDDPVLGPTWMPGLHVHLTDSPGAATARHLPDADRANILAELETPTEPPTTRAATSSVRWPLENISILDLTQVVAGPCAGRILVEYGADVIKISNPRARDVPAEFSTSGMAADPGNQQHEHLNRGKHTLRLDLQSEHGLRVFWKLVDQADVVMQNFPLGTAERYGIGFEQVHARKPDVVYFSLSAFGYTGPWGKFRGYEGNAQAVTGLMERFGGDGPPLSQPFLLDDYGTGVRGAFAVALGVLHKLRTGRGQHIQTALVETASYHQAAFLLGYAGNVWDEPRGQGALGFGPLQRLYRASDGWLFLGASADLLSNVSEAVGLAHVPAGTGEKDALERALEQALAQQTVAYWVAHLSAVGAGVQGLANVRQLMLDPWARAHGLSVTQTVEGVGDVTMPGPAPRLSSTPLRLGHPVHPPGADAPMLLERIGMADQLDGLVASGAIRLPALV
jgi:crotonobetainyl-CoA:carnitine CoA-transferase CaiB-like acyl-CoA transferase